ncbi:MAG: cysteine desulfurase family protein [Patescibacteria group bacterium]
MPKSIRKIKEIYLDYASAALATASNPGAIHALGMREKAKLENARASVAKSLNAHKNEIIFTSGATESNNLAILGFIHAEQEKGFLRSSELPSPSFPARPFKNLSPVPHIVTTNIEHASVLEVCKHLEKTKQAEVTYVEVEASGVIDAKKIKKALRENTVLVSVMYANNEIGTIQPIREIAKEIRHFRKQKEKQKGFPFFHTDAVQAVNYLPINMAELGVDLMSINSAKIYGPKGVGALYVKKNTPMSPIMFGGNQEFGLRPGTENVALAVGLAKALQTTELIKKREVERLTKLRDCMIAKLKNNYFDFLINGDLKNRLPNNINITIPNIPSDLLVIELSARGIMVSAKSACKSGDGKASHVIQAIDKNIKETDGSLRFSLGRGTTKKDIDYSVKALSEILTKLKKWYK